MKLLSILAGGLLTLAAVSAQAHAQLKSSTPREGEVLMQAPTSISLTFSESTRITTIFIQKDQDAKQKLTAPTNAGEQLSVSVPTLAPGSYTLSWKAASIDDGHIMAGELHFKVSAMKTDMPKKQ